MIDKALALEGVPLLKDKLVKNG